MSDDFDNLLKKLNDIQWDTLTSTDNLPGLNITSDYWGLSNYPLGHITTVWSHFKIINK